MSPQSYTNDLESDMAPNHRPDHDERTPLLKHQQSEQQNRSTREDGYSENGDDVVTVDFEDDDEEDPRNWSRGRKRLNVGIIALMASMFL